jgi:hypothetical protein
MSKNHKQIEARRRAKTAQRAKRNKAYAKPLVTAGLQRKIVENHLDDQLQEMRDRWFLLHGLNYLASDYATGVWSPIAPSIYADDFNLDQLPALETIFTSEIAKFYDETTQNWSSQGKILASWLMVNPETMRGIRMALLRHLAQQTTVDQAIEDLVKPHNPSVWGFFHDQIIARLA